MKIITNKTVLKQENNTFTPVEVDNVIYWVDESFKDSSKLVKGNALLFTKESGERELYYFDEHDGYGLGVYYLLNR